jgi:glycine/D-amino acid oxidase-like deaminating enzyme
MTLRVLRESGQPNHQLTADVCVIGAGIAGLIAAVRIARNRQLRVIVLESGLQTDDAAISALDRIDNPSRNYEATLRARGLGGTSRRWAGKLLPLTAADAGPRPWLDVAGWPFSIDELDRYTDEFESLLGVDPESYEESASDMLDAAALLPRGDRDFAIRWPKRPRAARHDLARVLQSDIQARANLEIWLGATVTQIQVDPNSTRVMAIEAMNHEKQRIRVEAREYLLAAGTLESTRLLLLADRESGGVVSRRTDLLGRQFNDHLGVEVATLRPVDRARTNRMLADRWPLGADRHLHFELRPAVQREHRIGSAYFDFGLDVPLQSSLTQTRLVIDAIRQRQPRHAISHAITILPDSPTLLWTPEDLVRTAPALAQSAYAGRCARCTGSADAAGRSPAHGPRGANASCLHPTAAGVLGTPSGEVLSVGLDRRGPRIRDSPRRRRD